jgi:ubiquitin C-terminal hydrolase
MVGLRNLGNTCYMNSMLQMLFQTPELMNYVYWDSMSRHDINPHNMMASKPNNALTYEFIKLIHDVKTTNQNEYKPDKFKATFGKIFQMFDDNMQHDAHTFLSSLLSKIHEDCNKIAFKPYVEDPSGPELI